MHQVCARACCMLQLAQMVIMLCATDSSPNRYIKSTLKYPGIVNILTCCVQSVPRNVKEQGLHGSVKDAQGNLQDAKNQQVGKDSPGGPKLCHTSA